MLFHLGSLWRLNDAGVLPSIKRISSVSGGSITAGVLALSWSNLEFDDSGVSSAFAERVVEPVRRLAGRTLDAGAVTAGLLLPGSIGDQMAANYDRLLFGGATLQDLPDDADGAGPRFIFNATNLQSGALWRFSRPYMGDWRVGRILSPTVSLARAVAASSAFPPVLSPVRLDVEPGDFEPGSGEDLTDAAYREDVFLSDGGVYDNLGLETVWKRYAGVLVSDAGGHFVSDPDPKTDWAFQTLRVLSVIDNQVRSLRKRQTIAAYREGEREGAYWGIRTDVSHYRLVDPLPCPVAATRILANTATRLKRLSSERQERLINWGYAVTDAALRAHVDTRIPRGAFPYPEVGVG